MQPEMPKPTDAHRRLAAMEGTWEGDEVLHPSPWGPTKRAAHGRFVARMDMDGFFLVSDYVERQGGDVTYRGHGVYGYEPAKGTYSMHWFDSMGGVPAGVIAGKWEGDTLAFSAQAPFGQVRYVYTFPAKDEMTFAIESSKDGSAWSPFMEGRYRRV